METLSSVYFLVTVKNSHDGWNKVGLVTLNKRCNADKDVKAFFPTNTRGYARVLESCRWLAAEQSAVSVDWQHRNMSLKTTKIHVSSHEQD